MKLYNIYNIRFLFVFFKWSLYEEAVCIIVETEEKKYFDGQHTRDLEQ